MTIRKGSDGGWRRTHNVVEKWGVSQTPLLKGTVLQTSRRGIWPYGMGCKECVLVRITHHTDTNGRQVDSMNPFVALQVIEMNRIIIRGREKEVLVNTQTTNNGMVIVQHLPPSRNRTQTILCRCPFYSSSSRSFQKLFLQSHSACKVLMM